MKRSSEKGVRFVEAFKKSENSNTSIESFIQNGLKKHNEQRKVKEIENRICQPGFSDEILELVREKLSSYYDPNLVAKVLKNYAFEVRSKKNNFQEAERENSVTQNTSRINSQGLNPKRTKDGMKIGEYVQKTFRDLFAQEELNSNDIQGLLSPDYSKRVFNAGFPVLRKASQGRADHKGYNRYYKEIFGGKYYLSSQWHVFHWDPFEAWLKEINRRG